MGRTAPDGGVGYIGAQTSITAYSHRYTKQRSDLGENFESTKGEIN